VVRPLALSEHLLLAAPQLLLNAPPPAMPADLAALPTLGLGNSPDEQRWRLRGPQGQWVEHHHRPRLVVDDVGTLLDAALAGAGCALLPRPMAHESLQRGALQPCCRAGARRPAWCRWPTPAARACARRCANSSRRWPRALRG
jgi:DNA-binding transcriptional LysR family regulator